MPRHKQPDRMTAEEEIRSVLMGQEPFAADRLAVLN